MARKKSAQRLSELGVDDSSRPKKQRRARGARLQKANPKAVAETPKAMGTGVVGPRVSSLKQLANAGSLLYQTDRAVRDLTERGITNVAVVDMLGETGSKRKPRKKFRAFLERIDAPDVTHVAIYDPGRAARNMTDFNEFLEILQRRQIVLVVDGQRVDPNDMNDELMLNIRALFAQYDNKVRTKAVRDGKKELALLGKLRQRLATGQVWASPTNEAYTQLLKAAGLLEQWLEDVEDYAYPSPTKDEPGPLYPGPVPDRKVYDALLRVVDIMREEMSITRTRERIKNDPVLNGKIPVHTTWRWRSGVSVRWRRVTDQWIYRFFTCPATYGGVVIVTHDHKADGTPQARPLFEAWSAFTGFATEADRLRILDAIEHPTRVRANRTCKEARNCALDRVFCATPLPEHSDGQPCGQRMSACYRSEREGQYVYRSSGCSEVHHHHLAIPGAALDALVEQTIRELIDPATVEAGVARLPLRADVAGEAERSLRLEYEKIDAKRESTKRTFEALDRHESPALYSRYAADLEQLTIEHAGLEQRLADHERKRASFAALAAMDLKQVTALASDFHRLADESRDAERAGTLTGAMRRLISEFVDRVDVMGIGSHAYNVTIRFRTGRQLSRQLFTAGFRVAHAELAFAVAASRSSVGADVARDLNGIARRHKKLNRWTAERVDGAVLQWAEGGALEQRVGPAESLEGLAARVGVCEEDLLREAFAGRLGPGWLSDTTDRVGLTPTDKELARVFPAHARRTVATEAGWPLAETVTIQRFADQHGHSAIKLRERVRRDPESFGVREDAFGRTYMRADDLKRSYELALERALEALPPSCAGWCELARDKWCVEADAARRTGVRFRTLIARGVPSIKIGPTLGDVSRRLFWIDAWTVRRQRCPSLVEAVADLGRPDIAVSDFLPSSTALARLNAIDPTITRRRWQYAIDTGRLIRIVAQQDSTSARPTHWVYLPPALLQTPDASRVQSYLRGRA